MKKILIVDDHRVFRDSLKQIIGKAEEYIVAGEASDAKEAEMIAAQIKPDLAVIDLSLPDKSGIQLTRALRTAIPDIRIVIVSMHGKIDYILAALRAGALGYIVKESVSQSLLNAFEAALHSEYYLDTALSNEIAAKLLEIKEYEETPNSNYGNLTAREQEILRLIAQGVAVKDIAEKLCISSKTVTNHRTNILSKLDLHSTADLVRFAARIGIIENYS